MRDPKLKKLLAFQLLVAFGIGPAFLLCYRIFGPPTPGKFPQWVFFYALQSAIMLSVYMHTIYWARRSVVAARAKGAPSWQALEAGLLEFTQGGCSLGFYPTFFVILFVWQWSLPPYALYFLYLLQLHLRWKRYQQALATAQGA